jgi:hypothetical protein
VSVDPGDSSYRSAAVWMGGGGVALALTGGLILGLGYGISGSTGAGDDMALIGGVGLGVGAGLLVGGILFGAASGTDFEFVKPEDVSP